jgi:putative flippase GtrA
MEQTQSLSLTKRDYFFITFIGIAFALFALPILKNIAIAGIKINFATAIFLILFFVVFANLALFIASLIAKKIPVILQIAKFAAVGAFNTFLDWGIVNLLMAITQIFAGTWYAVFNVISFLAANSGSYFWNKYWTFSSGNKSAEGGFLQFFGVTLVGLLLKVSIAYGIVNFIALPAGMTAGRWANVGLALGTMIALVWNFLGYKFVVFKK